MSYLHCMYSPYQKGDRVKVLELTHQGKTGKVTVVQPEDAFEGEDAVYWVTFDGETEECKQAFSYWQLEPEG